MLVSSWALLRTRAKIPCVNTTRTTKFIDLFLSNHRSVSGQRKNEPITITDYPIDIIQTQTTLRQLELQIHRQNHKQSSVLMTDFLASVPADDAYRLSSFRKLKSTLTKYPRGNLVLIIQLGIEYANLGYTEMVKEEILPLVKHFATAEQLAHFELELAFLSSSPAELPENFFESRSSDYKQPGTTKIRTTSPPQNVSRASFYPEPSLPSEDVFEEEGEEYQLIQLPGTSSDHAFTRSAGVLKRLVLEGRYDQAHVLLKEINDLGGTVPLSLEYEKPAIAALKSVKLDLDEKLKRFTAWFSLIPPRHLTRAEVNFEEIRRLLLQTHLLHVALLIRFSLITAEKGFVDGLSIGLIPHVIRCTSPAVGRTFIDDYCKAYERYLSDPCNGIPRVPYQIKNMRTNIRGQAIRSLAYSGRLDEAIALLPDLQNPTFRLTTYTYNIILQRLHALPKAIRQQNIDLVKKLRGSGDSAIRVPSTTDFGDAWEAELVRDEGHILETAEPTDFGGDLVAMLRYLKAHISNDKRSEVAHPFTIVNFMSLYLATGRTRALKMLLNKALRKSFFATSNFVFAEMLFYRRLQQPQLIVQTFVDHFWLSGLPRDEVLSRYFRFRKMIDNFDRTSGEEPPLRRFCNFDTSQTLPRGKMWPKRVHCNIMWDALVKLTASDRLLEVLYGRLLDIAEKGTDNPQYNPVTDEVPISGLWRVPVGAAAFTPFMTRMMFHRGPSYGIRILRDMLRLGVRPTAYHYTQLSGFYARRGDVNRVLLILDGMERGRNRNLPEQNSDLVHGSGSSEAIHEYLLPPPTLVTYVSVLRGFLIAKNLQGAEAVSDRLSNVYKYVPGTSRIADLAIQDLKDFKVAGPNWIYPHHRDSD